MEAVEVYLILEQVVLESGDFGPVGPEKILFQSNLAIPDVLGGEREEDLLAPGFPETSGKEIEKVRNSMKDGVEMILPKMK